MRSSPFSLTLDKSSSSPRYWPTRRAVRATFLLAIVVSGFLLFENASYLSTSRRDFQLQGNGNLVTHSGSGAFYIRFKPPAKVSAPRTLKPSLSLPSSCLDSHIAKGDLCYNPAEPKLDVVWTWVNGTDELLYDAKTRIENDLHPDDPYRPYRPNNAWAHVRQFRQVIYLGLVYRLLYVTHF